MNLGHSSYLCIDCILIILNTFFSFHCCYILYNVVYCVMCICYIMWITKFLCITENSFCEHSSSRKTVFNSHANIDSSRAGTAFYESPIFINPLDSKGNYSATLNNMKLVHWPLMGGLLHLVQRGGAWAGFDVLLAFHLRILHFDAQPAVAVFTAL